MFYDGACVMIRMTHILQSGNPKCINREGPIFYGECDQNSMIRMVHAFPLVSWVRCGTCLFVCLFVLILYVPSTIFQLNRDGSSWVEPVLS